MFQPIRINASFVWSCAFSNICSYFTPVDYSDISSIFSFSYFFLIVLLQWFWSVPESKLCQIKNVGTLRKHPCKSLVLVKFSVSVQYYFSLLQILFKQTFSCEFYLGYDICLPFLFAKSITLPLREYCPNMEFFLVCIFPRSDWNTDQKKLRIWIRFTQCAWYRILTRWVFQKHY